MRRFTWSALALSTALLVPLAWAQQDVITTAIGGGPDQMPALDANIDEPIGLFLDAAGNYYTAAYAGHRVFKIDNTGKLTVLAGTGISGYAGDGVSGGARQALLNGPIAVVRDTSGNFYIADYTSCVVRKVDTTNTITTIAGTAGSCNFNGDGAPATNFHLFNPYSLALDNSGNLFIADYNNCRVRKLALASNTLSTYAGTGTCSSLGDAGLATLATVNHPGGVATDPAGNLFIGDTLGYRIRKVTVADGNINTVAGTGTAGYTGDGGPATSAKIYQVYGGLAVDNTGTVTIAEYNNGRIRQFTVGGNITTIAGKGSGFCGDGLPALQACFNGPDGLALGSGGSIYVADRSNRRIRQFTIGGNMSTVAGNGDDILPTPVSGIPPQGVVLNNPWGLWQDPAGNVYVADTDSCLVRQWIRSSNVVNIFAGTGVCGNSGDGGSATLAKLNKPYGIGGDSAGNIYIADTLNQIVRKVDTSGNITTFAGQGGLAGYTGDGGPAVSAKLRSPYGVFVDRSDNVYIADTSNHVIRKVTAGVITTIAGTGVAGFLGDGTPAVTSKLNTPYAMTVDPAGNVFISDYLNCRVREVVASTGIINTVVGNGTCGFTGDGPATQEGLYRPQGLIVDANGNLFITDTYNHRVRWVDVSGNMVTIAGNGSAGYTGDGAQAFLAELYYPSGVTLDATGNLMVADQSNLRVRRISAFSALNSSVSSLAFGLVPLGGTSTFQAATLSAVGPVTISSISTSGDFTEYDNCGTGLANGQTCKVIASFKPRGAGTRNGSLTIQDNGFFSQSTTIALTGIGSAIQMTGNPVTFDNQLSKTTSAAKNVTLKNLGTTGITMGTISLNQTTDFAISARTCPAAGAILAAQASCTVSIVFKPQTTGAKKGALIVVDSDASSPQIAGVTGTGFSNVNLNPATVTFSAQAVGTTTPTSGAKKITLTNNTGTALTLGNPALTITGPFSKLSATSCANGLVIPTGGTCLIYVLFTPTSIGYLTGTVSVKDSDATSPQSIALAGTGTGVQFNPSAVDFGTSTVGHQVSSTVTMTNVSQIPISFTAWAITGTNAKDFTSNAANPPCAGTLAPGAACIFTMYFTPSLQGAETASFLVYDTSPASPQVLPLTGVGQ
ncbi:MAG: choice-of-anchor D domain-containing protein [Bryobacteraceae bacterium]